jgi:hypothetical protein
MKTLRPILLSPAKAARASVDQQELAPRLLAMPQIRSLSEQAGLDISRKIRWQLTQHPEN